MTTTNLFWRPVFKEGAFTANDPAVRRFAVKKTCEAIDLGAELGAEVYVMWGGREGVEADAAKDVRVALDRYKEAVDLCCAHIRDRVSACVSPSNRSPTSPAATSCFPPSATRSRSWRARVARHGGPESRVRPRDDERTVVLIMPSRRRSGTTSCSTSTSTRSGSASSTRTSGSAPRVSATRSTS